MLQKFLALHEGLGLLVGVTCSFTLVNESFSTLVGDIKSPIVGLLEGVKVLGILIN